MLKRSRVMFVRSGRGVTEGERQVVKAAKDEASPAALRRKTPEAQNLLHSARACFGGVFQKHTTRAVVSLRWH
jgi:predicted aconitase with swiveling domain